MWCRYAFCLGDNWHLRDQMLSTSEDLTVRQHIYKRTKPDVFSGVLLSLLPVSDWVTSDCRPEGMSGLGSLLV